MSAKSIDHGTLWNEDLAPTGPDKRTWGRWNIAALWVGMSICVPTYMLAASLVKAGMLWWQAVLTILGGNLIVLVPMVLNAHAGTKHGIPFPVLLRAPFGVLGSNVPAMMRALVACGWFGIQTWIGGAAIYTLLLVFYPGWKELPKYDFLGISQAELGCFLGFWALNVYYILRGTESIKWMETLSAPFLLAVGLALLAWGIHGGGGLGNVLGKSEAFARPSVTAVAKDGVATVEFHSFEGRATEARAGTVPEGVQPTLDTPWAPVSEARTIAVPEGHSVVGQLRDGDGHVSSILPAAPPATGGGVDLLVFLASLTAMVSFWATLSLNIPDFTRFARSQKDQGLGQLYGLPTTMALYSFIGVAVTCAAMAIFKDLLVVEDAPWDPVALLGRFEGQDVVIVLAMFALAIATLTTNIAANVVSPANDFSNLAPRTIGFRAGGLITAFLGIAIMPWKLIATTQGYIFTWLIGYSALLGPIGGIMIADYYVVRKTRLRIDDLYRRDGAYSYGNGFNTRALVVLAIAILPNVPGFLADAGFVARNIVPEIFREIYTFAWFTGFAIAFLLHAIVAKRDVAAQPSSRAASATR